MLRFGRSVGDALPLRGDNERGDAVPLPARPAGARRFSGLGGAGGCSKRVMPRPLTTVPLGLGDAGSGGAAGLVRDGTAG
mmetsp:Transcript_27049/g.65700  ORF Transcript_27049/g.65700 Transcript_27049/m.65700 type:complete len:80 (-) Transcript_27049:24-263(-)